MTEGKVEAMIDEFDTSNSGDLSFHEFRNMMSHLSDKNLMQPEPPLDYLGAC